MSESGTGRKPWEKAEDEVLDECVDILGYSGMTGAREAAERMKERWKAQSQDRVTDAGGDADGK